MNIQRAQEILQSEETIPVYLNGKSVWLEEIFPESRMVLLHDKENPSDQQTVSADELKEAVH